MIKANASLTRLTLNYNALLALCDALEGVADELPRLPKPGRCRLLAYQIEDLLAATHHEEDLVLLPLLEDTGRSELKPVAARIRREHDRDAMAAIEIRDALMDMAQNHAPASADATGYMLRSFFESLRRHVEAERDLLALLDQLPIRTKNLH